MEKICDIHSYGWIRRLADTLMVPIMYVLSGTFREKPQETHPWNVQRLTPEEVARLDGQKMYHWTWCKETEVSRPHWWSWLYHAPIFGGWRCYIVLQLQEPKSSEKWYIGWLPVGEKAELSIIPIEELVRVLVGPGEVSFFALDETGVQTAIPALKGYGFIGNHVRFGADVPLR